MSDNALVKAFRWQPKSRIGVFLMWAVGAPLLGLLGMLFIGGVFQPTTVISLAIVGVVVGWWNSRKVIPPTT